MGLKPVDLMARLSSAYDSSVRTIDTKGVNDINLGPDNDGTHLVPGELEEGQQSTTETIIFKATGTQELTVVLDPSAGTLELSRGDVSTRTVTIDGFDRWLVQSIQGDRYVLGLKNNVRLEVFSRGIVRLENVQDRLSFNESADDITAVRGDLVHELSDDDWWLASTSAWSTSSDALSSAVGALVTLFPERRGEEEFIAHVALLDADTLQTSEHGAERLARTLYYGYYSFVEQDLALIEEELTYADRTGDLLQRTASDWGVPLRADESDESLLIRFKGRVQRLRGGITEPEMKRYVAALLRTDPDSITITENKSPTDGLYEPAFFEVQFTTDLLDAIPEDNSVIISDIETVLQEASQSGVLGEVDLVTSATYDSGALYDDDESFGS